MLLFHISITFFQNLKKIEFLGYFTHRLVLQRNIKAWSRMIVASELSLVISNILCQVLTCVSISIGRLTHTTVVKRVIDSGFKPLN